MRLKEDPCVFKLVSYKCNYDIECEISGFHGGEYDV
jgi:hypothetical protein